MPPPPSPRPHAASRHSAAFKFRLARLGILRIVQSHATRSARLLKPRSLKLCYSFFTAGVRSAFPYLRFIAVVETPTVETPTPRLEKSGHTTPLPISLWVRT